MIAFRSAGLCAALAALALFAVPASASAATSSKAAETAPAAKPSPKAVATAMELLKIKGAGHIYAPILVNIIQRTEYKYMQTNPMLQNDLDASALQVRKAMQPELDSLEKHVAEEYASHFTEKELEQIVAFYKTPLGHKLVTIEPKVLAQSMDYARQWAAKVAQQVDAKMREEMQKRGHDL